MKLLIIEDDPSTIDAFNGALSAHGISADFARSKTSALELVGLNRYDYIVLDLQIPTDDCGQDADEKLGEEIFLALRNDTRTPICIFSSFSTNSILQNTVEDQKDFDIWGEGEDRKVITVLGKNKMDSLIEKLVDISQTIRALDRIEVSHPGVPTKVVDKHYRTMRIFARQMEGDAVKVSLIGKGLSSSVVLKVNVTRSGRPRCELIGKFGDVAHIRKENKNYDQHILRLANSFLATKSRIITWGGIDTGAIFYGIADGGISAFQYGIVQTDDATLDKFFTKLRRAFKGWSDDAVVEKSIEDIRRRLVSDDAFAEIRQNYPELPLDQLDESKIIRVRWPCVHGDLHGENIIVDDADNRPCVIDFGDIGHGPACLDPITLELSFLFHPSMGRTEMSTWPTLDQAASWDDAAAFFHGSSAQAFLERCRVWATEVQANDREYYATLYAYILRQFKYENPDVELATVLLNHAIDKLNEALNR